jgi:hypothetical protein
MDTCAYVVFAAQTRNVFHREEQFLLMKAKRKRNCPKGCGMQVGRQKSTASVLKTARKYIGIKSYKQRYAKDFILNRQTDPLKRKRKAKRFFI